MRKAILFLACLGISGSLWAADPIVGTWKLNLDKSKFEPGFQLTVREQTSVIKELENNLYELESEIHTNGTGKTVVLKFHLSFPEQGGMEVIRPPVSREPSIVVTRIGPGDWCFTHLNKEGRQARISQFLVSKDGLNAQEKIRSFDSNGKPIERRLFFDKQ